MNAAKLFDFYLSKEASCGLKSMVQFCLYLQMVLEISKGIFEASKYFVSASKIGKYRKILWKTMNDEKFVSEISQLTNK